MTQEVDDEAGSPSTQRMILGDRLRVYRVAAGLSVEDVARYLRTSPRTVTRWERGDTNIRLHDLGELLTLYRVPEAERRAMEEIALDARRPGWWVPYGAGTRLQKFLGLEAGALNFQAYNAATIPGLLQTEDYMRAILREYRPALDDKTIESRVAVRLQRQADTLARKKPAHFVIDEACLRRQIGGIEVLRRQLDHVIDLAATSPFLTIQVLSFESGAAASVLTGFVVFEFERMRPVAYIEGVGGDLYADGDESDAYATLFDMLREHALSEPDSLALVGRIREVS